MKKKKERKCEAVPAGTAVRGHGVNDGKPVSERARIRGAGEDVSTPDVTARRRHRVQSDR